MRSKGLFPNDVINLQLIKQNSTEGLNEAIEAYVSVTDIERYNNMGLLSYIKPKKKGQSSFELVRLSSLGKQVLDNLEIPEVLEQDIIIFDWLSNIYLSMDKSIGNAKKTKLFIALFRVHSGISENCLAHLCKVFINDQTQMEYNHTLQYLFFKPDNLFTTKFDIDSSRLYNYYLKNQKEFNFVFEKLKQ